MGWHNIPEFETVSSSDDNPFAGACVQPTGKVSVKLPVDDWLCRKMGKLNLTITEGTLQETLTLLVSSKISLSSHPDLPDGMGCILRRRTVRATQYAPGHRNRPNSTIPSAPPSRTFSQDMLRHWERAAREQTVMCNQAAGLSRCLTRVQDAMSSQLKTLHLDKKGKSSERTKQAIDELEYLVTFNRTISQAMARTMQDLSEGVFISMTNFTLVRRDSYLEYLHAGVKQDTLNTLRTSPVHLNSLFPDQLITKAEEEICRSEERHSSGQPHRRQGRFHPYASSH